MKLLILAALFNSLLGAGMASPQSSLEPQIVTSEKKLKKYIARDFENRGRIEVERIFVKESIPTEAEVISVEPRPALGLVNVEFAWPEGGTTHYVFGSALVKLYAPIVVAKTVIRNNESFTKDNCTLQEREVSPYRVTGFYDHLESLKNLRARGYINPGIIISHTHTQAPFLVNLGESVQLVSETPAVKVSIRAKALENGRENQWIRIENISNKKVLQAKVISPGEVSLH